MTIQELLKEMVARDASDLHLTAGSPPQFRVDGSMQAADGPALSPQEAETLVYSLLTEEQRKRYESEKELDFSFSIPQLSRFRANVYCQRGVTSLAVRRIPLQVRALEDLGLPPVVAQFAQRNTGLILVTGPTGSGKSTTLAALIDRINRERASHIITVEDPIEYVHAHRKSLVTQREVHQDTASFAAALKYVLRQDPDVILIGEMRDLETISAAITIAETGHLVLATLHTNSAYESVSRIVDVFPPHQQKQVLTQLAFVLEGVVTQQLLPKATGKGRVLVAEVLVCTQAVKAVIREGKLHQIYTLMQAGQKFGIQTMNQGLAKACRARQITREEAFKRSPDPKELEQILGQASPQVSLSGSWAK